MPDPKVSNLAFGSMRMLEAGYGVSHWTRLLEESAELGVLIWHSSDEYDSYSLYCNTLSKLTQAARQKVMHVVKLGEPNFEHRRFSSARLIERIDRYLAHLDIDTIYALQWMWRADLKFDERRTRGAARDEGLIEQTFERVKSNGKVRTVLPFPYSLSFAQWVIGRRWCDGLVCYLNPVELEMLPLCVSASEMSKRVIALRPLFSGKALSASRTARSCFQWASGQPGVIGAVVSFSTAAHRDELMGRA
jgi:hypothetical protein